MKLVNTSKITALLLFLCFLLESMPQVLAQGCVAIRNMSCSSTYFSLDTTHTSNHHLPWTFGLNSRYFKSFRHFRGDHEEKERVANGTEVINKTFSIDVSLGFQLTNRWSFSAVLPLVFNDRSSLYEHYGNSINANPEQKRFATQSQGIGDVRITANYLLKNPDKFSKWNLSLGLGIKLPTGNANVQDDFHRRDAEEQDYIFRRPVDQSIQLGDKGWGFSLETQGNWEMARGLSLYFNGFYLFNPRNTNETITRGTLVNVDPLIAYLSVADQFSARLGVSQAILAQRNLQIGIGGRIEGIPSQDLIGKSEGFRRPGYIVSVEPSVSYQWDTWLLGFSVPVAIYRNRTKSTFDLADPAGNRHGDAAFADYSLNLSIAYRFGR